MLLASKALLAAAVVLSLFAEFNTHEFLAAYQRWPHSGTPSVASRLAASATDTLIIK